MKLATLVCLLASIAFAQPATQALVQPDCMIFFHFTAVNQTSPTAPNAGLDNRTAGCTTWNMSFAVSGFATATVELQSAVNNAGVPGAYGPYAGSSIISPAPHNNNPITTATQDFVWIAGYNPWVQVKLTGITGGPGIVDGAAYGWRIPSASANGTGGVASSVNVAQWGGTNAVNGGVAGSPGVGGLAASGTAPAGNPVLTGSFDGTNVQTNFICPLSAPIATSTSGNTVIVSGVAAQQVRICNIAVASASPVNIKLQYGHGSACATGATDLTGAFQSVSAIALDFTAGGLRGAVGEDVCLNLSSGVQTSGVVTYTIF